MGRRGEGITALASLPEAVNHPVAPVPPMPQLPLRRTGTILVVEDQTAIRHLAEDTLSEEGHQVLSAGDGPSALRLAEDHHGKIDLLVTDVVMPGMSGPQLAGRLTRSRPGLIVLYISGYTDHVLLEREVNEKGTGVLQKPFRPDSLAAKVQELLRPLDS